MSRDNVGILTRFYIVVYMQKRKGEKDADRYCIQHALNLNTSQKIMLDLKNAFAERTIYGVFLTTQKPCPRKKIKQ